MDGSPFGIGRAQPEPAPEAAQRDLLRFLTCGSVDDGKSTLIGRLLFETGQVHEDQLAVLAKDSRRFGTDGEATDYALLLDGLEAEREQGITIDVAYRYFASPRRSFIVADAPGHEQYTRNMATGASNCDLAVILVDASKGLTDQTRRHSRICSLFGIRQVIVAVNKIDRIAGDEAAFRAIEADYAAFARELDFQSITTIPLSARHGDNLVAPSPLTPWYDGPTLLQALETAETVAEAEGRPFRFPVQYVNRPDASFRGYAGTVASGQVKAGDRIVVAPSGRTASIARIVTWDGDQPSARAGDAVTLVLSQEVDIARGDVLAHPHDRPAAVDRFAAHVLWMDETPLDPQRSYLLRIGTKLLPVRVSAPQSASDAAGSAPDHAATLEMNGIGQCVLTVTSPIAFDAFRDEPALGAFVLIDRQTNATVAAGTALHPVDQVANIHLTNAAVERRDHERQNGHRGGAVWLTGLSGSGKSTIAKEVERRLHARGIRTTLLDGDNLRHGLNRDLGFSDADRAENVRRAGEVAKLFAESGVIALCALISPARAQREALRERFGDLAFVEVYVDADIEVCRARDTKGLYARAAAGELKGMTGVDSPYDVPEKPDLVISSQSTTADEAATKVIDHLIQKGLLWGDSVDSFSI